MSDHWTVKYIGLPYLELGRTMTGADCYGLAVLAYRQELGIELQSYVGSYQSADERREIALLVGGAQSAGPWKRVDGVARTFDLAVFRRGPWESHIGLVVSPGLMLHLPDDHAKIEHYKSGKWLTRLTGVFRYCETASKVAS